MAIQDDIPGEVHHAHASGAERLDDAVVAEVGAGCQTTVAGRDIARRSRVGSRNDTRGWPRKLPRRPWSASRSSTSLRSSGALLQA